MTKTYYLFGQQATNNFYETGGIDEILSENIEHCTHCFDPETDPTADLLLSVKDGWDGSAQITEDQYELLNNTDLCQE